MKLKKLLKEVPVKEVRGSKEIEITGICANSHLVAPGNLFVAKRGRVSDGTRYIPQAIAAGAAAILADLYDPFLKDVTQLIDIDVATIEAQLASHFYQHPSKTLFIVGVTGTSGKTTTAYLTKHLLDSLHGHCGLIGTIEYIIGNYRYQSSHTTPDVCTNHKMLREMVIQQCQSAVMEVSSHALDQGRVANIEYNAAIYTNLSQEHLDYHKDMEDYARAKNLLFRNLAPEAFAIVNQDDSWHPKIIAGCKAHIFTYGLNGGDLTAKNIRFTSNGTQFEVSYKGETVTCEWSLIGRYNVYNYLAAAAVGISRGASLTQIAAIMKDAPAVPGRLEAVPNKKGLRIYVDYAHKDDALKNVLSCLKEFVKGKIITIFGCGGDRDKAKRPRMSQIAEQFSGLTIVTSDNPRTEDPEVIIREIIAGFTKKDYIVIADRKEAIAEAIAVAAPEDIILIAGKGHETYQIFAHKTIDFDDRKVAQEICQTLR